ncbi:helix-turn-helix domain-containing protein [Frankia sp. ACN1ag]|uniref:helix-turn-helix domain-containing protein n=1 Tax=Frankia sp. ACN1ag TaxID=102891 RepID=UPI000AC2428F|nr:helix-turn-helix domain-containing protein [Frankia sp. ACN1ag]
MVPSIPRGAVRALFTHARAVPLAPAPGVSVRACRAVLVALVVFVDRDSWSGAWPAVATLAERAEVSIRTARRALRALEAAGVIVTEVGGGRRSSRYRLVRPPAEPDAVTGQAGQDDRRSPVFTPPLPSVEAAQAAPRPKRIRKLPEDLRPLADALTSRGLRASFSLTGEQVADVRAALSRHGVPALVGAAYRAHQPLRPARWWSAWLGLWSGLHAPSGVPAGTPATSAPPAPQLRPEVNAAGAAACRAVLAARRRAA